MSELLPELAARAVASLENPPSNLTKPGYAEYAAGIATAIRNATHVVLPRNGEIYRAWEGQEMPEYECQAMASLPGPICTFEFSCNNTDRVVVAWSRRQLGFYEGDDALDDEILLTDVRQATTAEERAHVIDIFGENIWLPEQSRLLVHTHTKIKNQTLAEGQKAFVVDCSIYPDTRSEADCQELLGSPKLFADAYGRAIFAISQACVAMQAGATLEERSETSASRRWRMEKKGVGGFTYHVLKLPHSSSSGAVAGGSHGSPRLHIRRAHLRKLPTGVLTFVRQCFVGDGDRGAVGKHYKMLQP